MPITIGLTRLSGISKLYLFYRNFTLFDSIPLENG